MVQVGHHGYGASFLLSLLPIPSAENSIILSHGTMSKQVVPSNRNTLFTTEELEGIDVIEEGNNFIAVQCGCTNSRYGDSAGKLKIYAGGKLEISCDCYPGCKERLRPREFEKHAGLSRSNWRLHVWVFVNGDKVPLKMTNLLKYYKGSATDPCPSIKPQKCRTVHRDELVKCSNCDKERRFSRRTTQECKIYHRASAYGNWTCSDYPYQNLNCEDEEERVAKKKFRGCPRKPLCKGCTSCCCYGCDMCCFADCPCRLCQDFIQNAEPNRED